jgi:rhamnulokinase
MSPERAVVAAVDLGASSGRVVAGLLAGERTQLREMHRFPNTPVRVSGTLYWDILRLYQGILDGLQAASSAFGSVDAVGIDGWAVDYALLAEDGSLLGNPVHYRDQRTAPIVAELMTQVGAPALFGATGIAVQPFNTLFQLAAEIQAPRFGGASQVLLVPDLMAYWLSGRAGTELTNASTTGLLDVRNQYWSAEMASLVPGAVDLFPPLRRPGMVLGPVRVEVAAEAGIEGNPLVVTVPSHDTAAAVAGIPAATERYAYVCTGTWALVGMQLPRPVITEAARSAGFTNELAADGSIRFLRNVTGFWLLQECVRSWRAAGLDVGVASLADMAAEVPALRALVDVQDSAFMAPGDMPRRITDACIGGGPGPATPAEITRCILDSMALAVRMAVRDAGELSGRDAEVLHVVGGGVANTLFCQLLADACALPVEAGPAEAASWGNALYQARALGFLGDDVAELRHVIRAAEGTARYGPQPASGNWDAAERQVLEARAATARR